MPKKKDASPKGYSQPKRKGFNFNFESSSFSAPDDDITLPSQSLRALKLISLVQLCYAVVGYAITIVGGLIEKSNDIIYSFIQAPGGISLLTIIAAVLARFECNSRHNRTQLVVVS